MTGATPASVGSCRAAAVLLCAGGAALLLLGVIVQPPLLERFVLVSGEVRGKRAMLAFAGLGLVLLAAGGVTLALAFRLWRCAPSLAARDVQIGAIALGLTLLLTLAIAELAVRIFVPPETLYSGDAFWIHRYVSAGGQTFASDHPMNRYDPELGWAPVEGYRGDGVTTNSRGLRGLREVPRPKPAGERRILVVGDSFTFGDGVPDADVYTAKLEARLPGVRVVNLGVLGYGTDQQYLRLRQMGFDYEPDLVLLGLFAPNIDRNVLRFRDAPKPVFEVAGGALRLENVPVPRPATDLEVPVGPLRIFTFLHSSLQRALDPTWLAPKWEVTGRILDAMLAACREHGVPFHVAFFPDKRESFLTYPPDDELFVAAWARSRGVPFASVRPAFAALSYEDQRRVYHGHWTPFGNEVVAEAVAGFLRAHGFGS